MARMIALLRGINVGGHKRVPMEELRHLAGELAFTDVTSYIQSGNLVFSARMKPTDAEVALEKALAEQFGFPVDVIVRTAKQWAIYAAKNPFPDAAKERPQLLHLGLSKRRPQAGATALLLQRAKAGERVKVWGDAIWVDFVGGVGRSRLTPAVLDRAVGSPVTARNWKTVCQLAEL